MWAERVRVEGMRRFRVSGKGDKAEADGFSRRPAVVCEIMPGHRQLSFRRSYELVLSSGQRNGVRVAVLFLLGVSLAAAQQQQPAPPQRMTFFVTSEGSGKGADLGGLKGADQRCQMLATAVGAGDRTWHAYLSTQATGNQPAINARDRIGTGPWYNSKGARIAKDLGDLHGDTLEQARLGSSLTKITALTEKGDMIAGPPDDNQRHDILTGSQPDGRAFTDAARPYVSQLDQQRRRGCANRPSGSHRWPEYLVEFSAYQPRLQSGQSQGDGRRRAVLLFRGREQVNQGKNKPWIKRIESVFSVIRPLE